MTLSLDALKRRAKHLSRAWQAGESDAVSRVAAVLPDAQALRHADALHVIAREAGFASWPRLKIAVEIAEMDRGKRAERLKIALYFGQHWVVDELLAQDPDLGRETFGLACALYDIEHVRAVLAKNPAAATRPVGVRSPICHLCFSQHSAGKGSEKDMLAVAEALLSHGADVNDFYNYDNDPDMPLSCLYGALGHANNMALARWLLDHGADPNDNESLYHSTELGHHDGLRMLIAHGADPAGTNALPRALDFNDAVAVRLLLDAGADPNEGIAPHPSGEPSFVIPSLHQAARRMCDAQVVGLLLEAGADPSHRYLGVTPYSMARVYGNGDAARLIAEAGGDTDLSSEERLLAAAADGSAAPGVFIDPAKLPEDYRNLIRMLLTVPGRLAHIRRLVALGLEYDRPDDFGLTPVQIAGWEGMVDEMDYLMSLKPDLSHVNAYGGTLLSTIIHGSENAPNRAERDHIGCLRLALHEGVALPQREIDMAGDQEVAAFLHRWGADHPGQVVGGD